MPFLGRESAEIDMTSIKLKTKEGRGRRRGLGKGQARAEELGLEGLVFRAQGSGFRGSGDLGKGHR